MTHPDNLPPLPDRADYINAIEPFGEETVELIAVGDYYTADQMHAYARAAIAASKGAKP